MNKGKEAWRKSYVIRRVSESENDYRWWRHTDTEPAEGYVVDTWTYSTPAYPRAKVVSNRQPPKLSMSRRKLRRRLYSAGFRGKKLKAAFNEIVASPQGADAVVSGLRYSFGWHEKAIQERLGNRGWKVLVKGYAGVFLIFDEFGYYAKPNVADLARSMQSISQNWQNGIIKLKSAFESIQN